MRTPDAIRQRRYRKRRKLGLALAQIEVSQEVIALLRRRGYEPGERNASIGQAVTALLSDLVLEAA
jgi:hypothetical protein